jgi:uncharacterized membrane protein YqhA
MTARSRIHKETAVTRSSDSSPLIVTQLERWLWRARLMVVIPVVASLLLGLGVIVITSVDVVNLLGKVPGYFAATDAAARSELRLDVLSQTVAIVDGYLLAAIMVLFGLGLYELFISKLTLAEESDFADRLLHIESIDDLKRKLGRVVVLVLIVKFFQVALELKYQTTEDLLLLAIGVALMGVALYLTGREAG